MRPEILDTNSVNVYTNSASAFTNSFHFSYSHMVYAILVCFLIEIDSTCATSDFRILDTGVFQLKYRCCDGLVYSVHGTQYLRL